MMRIRLAVMICAIALFGGVWGSAQSRLDKEYRVRIPFEFTMGNTTLPAGLYDFKREALENAIMAISAEGGPSAHAVILARLWGGRMPELADVQLIFSDEGGKFSLSELWAPKTDGFLLYIPEGDYSYEIIAVPH
jgi:hypothetical protein